MEKTFLAVRLDGTPAFCFCGRVRRKRTGGMDLEAAVAG